MGNDDPRSEVRPVPFRWCVVSKGFLVRVAVTTTKEQRRIALSKVWRQTLLLLYCFLGVGKRA